MIDQPVMLLVVAESRGSSPGRQGYKMAVGADGELAGSIGGGLMEVNLVEQGRALIGDSDSRPPGFEGKHGFVIELVHRANSAFASGMICSGRQTVIFKMLRPPDAAIIDRIITELNGRSIAYLKLDPHEIEVLGFDEALLLMKPTTDTSVTSYAFEKDSSQNFVYLERLGKKNELTIIGGGHCALALSEIMSRMDFHISIFDDRPDLNTLDKNKFADDITIIEGYEHLGDHIVGGRNAYIAVMTLGYASDEVVIRRLIGKPFKYFGVLGSRAKMATLLRQLAEDGLPADLITTIRTPIGIDIGSQTPEEIAVSICAEIIAVKNA